MTPKLPTPWIDFELNRAHHCGSAGVYRLTHALTGKFQIGACSDFYARLTAHASLLRDGVHFSQGMQELYDQSPEFYVSFDCTGHIDDLGVARKAAEELKRQQLDAEYNNALLLNMAPKRRPAGIFRGRMVEIAGRLYPNIEAVARAMGLTPVTAKAWTNSERFPLWKWAGGK
jgi:hypothetical protein